MLPDSASGDLRGGFGNDVESDPHGVATAKVSAVSMTMNLITTLLGAGILSMPWSIAGASILPAIGIIFLVLLLNAGTSMILVVAAERARVYDLGQLFRRMPPRVGQPARALCDIIIWISVFLCLVGDLVVAADSITPMIERIPTVSAVRPMCMAFVTLAVLPLCFLDQRHLAFSSALGIGANIYMLVLILIIFGTQKNVAWDCCIFNVGPGNVSIMSNLMQAGCVQMCILPMYEVMEHRSPSRFASCLLVSFSSIFMLFVVFSVSAYLVYGPEVSANVLNDLPNTFAGNLARIGMGFTALAVYPLMLISMIAPIQHSEKRARESQREFCIPSPITASASPIHSSTEGLDQFYATAKSPFLDSAENQVILYSIDEPTTPLDHNQNDFGNASLSLWRHLPMRVSSMATFAIVVLSGIAAFLSPNLGVVNLVTGAMSVGGLVAWVPGLMGIHYLGRKSWLWFSCMIALLVFGVIATLLCALFTDRQLQQVESDCMWHLNS